VPPRVFTIEDAIVYVRDDELIEITPREVRIRKRELEKGARDRVRREKKNEIKKFGG
jgi:GTP-binding protein